MKSIEELHQIACDMDLDTYVDPVSGFQVLTTKTHLNRGFCCGNSCRHCPFGHINVNQLKNLNSQILKPVLINWTVKHYGKPQTPAQRLMEHPSTTPEIKAKLQATLETHNPFVLRATIERKLRLIFKFVR